MAGTPDGRPVILGLPVTQSNWKCSIDLSECSKFGMEEINPVDLITELLLHIQQKTGFIVDGIIDVGDIPEIRAIIWKLGEAIRNANR